MPADVHGRMGSHTVAASSMVRDRFFGSRPRLMYSPRSISPGISRDTWPFEVIPMTARPVTIVSEAGATVSESLALSPEQERARAVLGGAVAELSGALLDPAREEIETRTLQAPWSSPIVEVLPDSASLTVRGAAFRVLDSLVDDPAAFLS